MKHTHNDVPAIPNQHQKPILETFEKTQTNMKITYFVIWMMKKMMEIVKVTKSLKYWSFANNPFTLIVF